jgi:hypothetical protein
MTDDNGSADLWWRACQVVLDEAGRARLHDTRAALNSIALGLEVIRDDRARPAPAPGTERVLDVMRRDLLAASDELTGLQALVCQVGGDELTRLGTSLDWVLAVAGPVAKRCGLDLELPESSALGDQTVHPRFALAVALTLVEAALATPRGERGVVRYDAAGPSLFVEWIVAPDRSAREELAPLILPLVPGTETAWTREGGRRQLRIDLTRAT